MPPVVVKKKKPPLVVEVKKAAPKPAVPKQAPLPKAPSPSKDQGPKEPKPVSKPEKKPEKPKGPEPIDKLQQHQSYLAEIEAIPSPLNEIARVCYFLTFLFNETGSTTTLFPWKDQVLRKIFETRHDCLITSYVRRGDRLIYELTPEAEELWLAETGGKQSLRPLYRTQGCYVKREKYFHDLYQFHVTLEPFRFLFYMPVPLARWVRKGAVWEPRLKMPITNEYALLRGKKIKMSRNTLGWSDEQLKEEFRRFLVLELGIGVQESPETSGT